MYAERRWADPEKGLWSGGSQGTSFASPHVSAAAALLIATKRLGPNPTPEQIAQRLKDTARDLGPAGADTRYGAGLLDAAAALAPDTMPEQGGTAAPSGPTTQE